MVTREEIQESIADGNLNPKMFKKFFEDMKIKSYTYDYNIQRDLVNYYEARVDIDPRKSKIMDDIFSSNSDRVIEITVSHQFVVPGEKERYKRSSVFNKPMTYDDITANMKYFKYNILVFVDDELFTNYRAKAFRERLNLYFLKKDLHDVQVKLDPDAKVEDLPKTITVLFLPNAIIGKVDNLNPRMFNGLNIDASNFPTKVNTNFSKATKYFGYWINKDSKNQYMIPYISYNSEYKYFTLPDSPPTNITKYSLMVVGMTVIKEYKDIGKNEEWIEFDAEKMPLPKNSLMVLREKNGSYVPIANNTVYNSNISVKLKDAFYSTILEKSSIVDGSVDLHVGAFLKLEDNKYKKILTPAKSNTFNITPTINSEFQIKLKDPTYTKTIETSKLVSDNNVSLQFGIQIKDDRGNYTKLDSSKSHTFGIRFDTDFTISEYFPNIYKISNNGKWNLRVYALYEDKSHNNHIDYDEEITPYLERNNLLDQYKDGSVPEVLKNYKPIQWNYSIQDYIEKNPYNTLDLTSQLEPFLYKMETISSMLKKWYLFYEEYQRRTFGFLSGWYHNIANYKNMDQKVRLDTAQDIDDKDLYYEFKEPQYLFTYVNTTEFGNANSYCFYIDGVYTIPTKIIVYKGYQYVYFPTNKIRNDSVIEVERFDGIVIQRDIDLTEDDITIKFSSLADRSTVANSLFFVNMETGEYLNHGELETTIIDPDIGDVVVDFKTSVYTITPSMSIKIKVKDTSLIGKTIRLCCNNQTFQFLERESGIDFVRGRGEEINLNRMKYIHHVNEAILPRIRIFNEKGRLIPKRNYYVWKHESYNDAPRFNLPMKLDDDEKLCVVYTGYDERLIYHKDVISSKGLVCLEGRTYRPFSFAYHDIYLDGYRLTKYDVEILAPYTILIKSIEKYDTYDMIEIYEKCHVDDKFVKFDYNEESEYIMDKLIRKETDFYQLVLDSLEEYIPTEKLRPIDGYRDHWYDFIKYYVTHHFINGDRRKDLEAFFHVFVPGLGRTLLNGDDRIRYYTQVRMLYYLIHDLTIDEEIELPLVKELDISSVIPNENIDVDENYYMQHGFIDNHFNPVYDDPYIPKLYVFEPTKGYDDAINYNKRYLPRAYFPHIEQEDIQKYVWVGGDQQPEILYPDVDDTNYKMSDLYPGFHPHMFYVPDDITDARLTTMAYMYAGCSSLVFAPDISMANVTTANNMFDGCKNLTFLPKRFNISKVKDLTAMFRDCESLNQVNIPKLSTSNATIFDDMFNGCVSLTAVPNLSLEKMTSMVRMFKGCSGLYGEFPIEINCANVTDLNQLKDFVDGTNITVIRLKNLDIELQKVLDTSIFGNNVRVIYVNGKRAPIISDSVYKMSDLYPNDYQTMTQLPGPIVIESELHTIDEMFKDCFKLENIEQFDISHVTSMKAAMENCTSLPRVFPYVIDLSNFDNIEPLRDLFKGSSVGEITFSGVSDALRKCLGIALSDNIEYIHFTNSNLLYFYPNKAKENRMYKDVSIELKN